MATDRAISVGVSATSDPDGDGVDEADEDPESIVGRGDVPGCADVHAVDAKSTAAATTRPHGLTRWRPTDGCPEDWRSRPCAESSHSSRPTADRSARPTGGACG